MLQSARCLKYRYYYNNWDLGHRYILNLRENEVYARHYHRLDADSLQRTAQRARHARRTTPIRPGTLPTKNGKDPEARQSALPHPRQRAAKLDAVP